MGSLRPRSPDSVEEKELPQKTSAKFFSPLKFWIVTLHPPPLVFKAYLKPEHYRDSSGAHEEVNIDSGP